ncbi:unnamed protein product [Dovyalis caffra]|uniref:Uncharacterized protein n=1 Tax=Dovyalis caffra TaxID=77055 RepID=A0AAV1SR32_9ROSI|nr:unnamed protein product [Dovyalis caffra]
MCVGWHVLIADAYSLKEAWDEMEARPIGVVRGVDSYEASGCDAVGYGGRRDRLGCSSLIGVWIVSGDCGFNGNRREKVCRGFVGLSASGSLGGRSGEVGYFYESDPVELGEGRNSHGDHLFPVKMVA